jgi:hypothetical protein
VILEKKLGASRNSIPGLRGDGVGVGLDLTSRLHRLAEGVSNPRGHMWMRKSLTSLEKRGAKWGERRLERVRWGSRFNLGHLGPFKEQV